MSRMQLPLAETLDDVEQFRPAIFAECQRGWIVVITHHVDDTSRDRAVRRLRFLQHFFELLGDHAVVVGLDAAISPAVISTPV